MKTGSKIITNSEQETVDAGAAIGKRLRAGDVLAFTGGLGAGKTAFIRGVALGLGLDARVSSPTFTIVNEYPGETPLFHFDLYRLTSAEELFEIGWEDYLTRGGVCCVEWSENGEDAFPPETIRVDIRKLSDAERAITITFPEDRA